MLLDDILGDILHQFSGPNARSWHSSSSPQFPCTQLGLGGGIRIIDGDRAAQAYVVERGEDGVSVDMPEIGKLPVPFLEGSLSFPATFSCKKTSPWRLEIVGQGVSSFFVPIQDGTEHVLVSYSSIEVDAATDWEFSLGTYISGGIGAQYSPNMAIRIRRIPTISFHPFIRGRVGFSTLQNTMDLDINLEDLPPLFEVMGQDEVEETFGFYYESSTDATIHGIGWYAEPGVGVQARANRFILEVGYSVRQEAILVHVVEKTTVGEGYTSESRTQLVADTSGSVFTASLRYNFSRRNQEFLLQ